MKNLLKHQEAVFSGGCVRRIEGEIMVRITWGEGYLISKGSYERQKGRHFLFDIWLRDWYWKSKSVFLSIKGAFIWTDKRKQIRGTKMTINIKKQKINSVKKYFANIAKIKRYT